jgi:hypothetical protein
LSMLQSILMGISRFLTMDATTNLFSLAESSEFESQTE